MARLDGSLTAAHVVVLVGPGVVHDITTALSGLWTPDREEDPARRNALVAAAQLRLYGMASDRSGWHLVTTAAGTLHAAAIEANDLEAPAPGEAPGTAPGSAPSLGADWSAGFLPALESYDDAPAPGDVQTLADLLRRENGLDAEHARTLALALLCEPVTLLVTREPEVYAHQRQDDLPHRLEIVDACTAVERLDLLPGEAAWIDPPAGSALAAQEAWWVPAPSGGQAPASA